jgi:hypothetical protein
LIVPNSFIPGRKGSLRIEIAANPNLTAAHWTVNGKEADEQKFKPLSLNQTRFQQVRNKSTKRNYEYNENIPYMFISPTPGLSELT